MTDETYLSRAFPKKNGSPGMFLRDYFAGQALAGMMADLKATQEAIESAHQSYKGMTYKEAYAQEAYAQADAMIKARAEQ